MSQTPAEQLAELQIVLLDQQRSQEEFGGQLLSFGERLARLERQVELMMEKLRQLVELLPQTAGRGAERPPHY